MGRQRRRYSPWRDARGREHLDILFVNDLPAGVRGRTIGHRIEINQRLLGAERRCTLAHELVHDERRIWPANRVLRAREEETVERIAARRLIAIDQLVDVLCWTRHTGEVAEELWVDVPMLTALVASLTDVERAWIDAQLEERGAA